MRLHKRFFLLQLSPRPSPTFGLWACPVSPSAFPLLLLCHALGWRPLLHVWSKSIPRTLILSPSNTFLQWYTLISRSHTFILLEWQSTGEPTFVQLNDMSNIFIPSKLTYKIHIILTTFCSTSNIFAELYLDLIVPCHKLSPCGPWGRFFGKRFQCHNEMWFRLTVPCFRLSPTSAEITLISKFGVFYISPPLILACPP